MTLGVGVISPIRTVIRGTPSPISDYTMLKIPAGRNSFVRRPYSPALTIDTRMEPRAQGHCGKSWGQAGDSRDSPVCPVDQVCFVFLVHLVDRL